MPLNIESGPHRIVSVSIRPCVQQQENPRWQFAGGRIASLNGWLIEIRAESGEFGIGYVEVIPVVSTTPEGALAALQWLTPVLLGENPFNIEAILMAMDRTLSGHRHVKAAIDCALHEICATILKQPISTLFGGVVQKEIDVIRIVPLDSPAYMAAEALKLINKGYRYVKIKLSGQLDLDVSRVHAIREAVGHQIHISVDPNQSYDTKTAIKCVRRLAAFNVDLIEQPVPAHDIAGLAEVRRSTDIIVEADESVYSLPSLLALIRADALDSANLKVADLGGLRNTLLCARLCESAGIRYRIGATFAPRLFAGQALQLAAAFQQQFYAQELAEFEHLLDDPFDGLNVTSRGTLVADATIGSGMVMSRPAAVSWECKI